MAGKTLQAGLWGQDTVQAGTFWGVLGGPNQGGITCGAIDEPRKSSKAIDERVIINFRDKNVVIARFATKMGYLPFYIYMNIFSYMFYLFLYIS